jgi:hypothetical protein
MKFTAKEDFLNGRTTFEEGNTYDSAKHDISDQMLNAFYDAGWVEIEGKDPSPDRNPGAVELKLEDSSHG